MKNPQSQSDAFAPKASMLKYAAACAAHDVAPDEASRCRAAGVSARMLARWRATPGFPEWLRGEIRRLLAERVWEIWAVLNRLAREGNIQAAKLFLDHFAPAEGEPLAGPDTFHALAELACEIAAESADRREGGVGS